MQTRRTVSLSDVDNTPESLSVLSDNDVHGLYDFLLLLNYMFLLPSLNILDVPLLYSPVPFENAAVFAPEVLWSLAPLLLCKLRAFYHAGIMVSCPIAEVGGGSSNVH
ncbi:hypothetical protein HanXRQr2_Chr13g0571661 [Helianthus annuus]|uniref:Uncharacterized protein n=1 Tax=Helianthus annuus TaxID=4232 RepID=A0A9K3HAJ8_HELAN|nr:hypothetical protein HanXRQr2_Chr13g0571661 [Helianthus annuus]